MKKFTKGCLWTALILFILGCIICGVCGVLGGFGQLENMNGIAGIPFRYYKDNGGRFSLGWGSSDEDESWIKEDWSRCTADKTRQQLDVTAEALKNIEIDVDECNLYIKESEDDHVWISIDGNTQDTYYKLQKYPGDSSRGHEGHEGHASEVPADLLIRNTSHHQVGRWRTGPNDDIVLYLPAACRLDSVSIDTGAGLMESASLKADLVVVDVGAGVCEMEALEAKTLSLVVGAGQIKAEKVKVDTANLEIGAGEIVAKDIVVQDHLTVDLAMGNAEITGTILGDLSAGCSMGNLDMALTGSEDDHGYSVDCGMGTVKIGHNKFSSISDERIWNEEKKSQFVVDCAMGDVTIKFNK